MLRIILGCRQGPRLDLSPDLQSAGRTKLELLGLHDPVIAIHPGSGSHKKNWPLPSFLALAGKIQQAGLGQVLWIVGEADEVIARSLRKEFPPSSGAGFHIAGRSAFGGNVEEITDRPGGRPAPEAADRHKWSRGALTPVVSGSGLNGATPILENCSLPEVASVLSQCRGYVGNDSGITHLAAAVGIPTLALFGPTDPAGWGPRGRQVSILRAQPPTSEGLARMTVDEVWRGLAAVGQAKSSV